MGSLSPNTDRVAGLQDPECPSPPTVISAEWVLLPDGWHQRMAITIGAGGTILQVSPADGPLNGQIIIPGMVNAHSHAFQRGLLGKTQRFHRPEDDFWSWRSEMYRAATDLTPDDQERVAYQAFCGMIQRGYTTVCEFHYTHGAVRMDHGEIPLLMSEAVLRGAERAGMRIRLLPVCYQRSGFGQPSLLPGQRPFGLTTDVYLSLVDHLLQESSLTSLQSIGYAPHSLRAVDREALLAIVDHRDRHNSGAPIHIHVAEQVREVNECVLSTGRRPIEYLHETVELNDGWCLVHATHATQRERDYVVEADVTICLCPTTEGDLGDGYFPLAEFMQQGGRWAIGSDANICLDPTEELRTLDWQQRLHARKRNAFRFDGSLSAGTRLYLEALEGGRRASGLPVGRLNTGNYADFIELRRDVPLSEGLSPDEILTAWIYSGDPSLRGRIWVGGSEFSATSAG